ncbi:LuxR family transcriptional regulator [Nonomuraea monospora]|uniref:LuxR family transcriptional regulator n=1 Tax=Nonomuraea monospora TaxID=568818 RepID=A0ABP5P3R3_9ACTN
MLEVLGVDRWGEEAYLALVGDGPLTASELAALTAVSPDVLGDVLPRLEDHGLISRLPGRPARYAALPPEPAIEVLLLARERDIERVRALAQHLGERHRRDGASRPATELIEVISGAEAVARCEQQLLCRAKDIVRGIDAPSQAVADHGVRRRFIHDRDTLQAAGQAAEIERSVAAGEEVRILPNLPIRMILADDDLGLIPLRATPRGLDSCVLVHPSSLLDALSALFELLWAQAQPFAAGVEGDCPPLSEMERRIVSLMAHGLSDEAIARQLGIGYRTVQRRIQGLMARLSATSRFQAGVLAARRGWWEPL